MSRVYKWIAVWDQAGLEKRNNGNATPFSNVDYLVPPNGQIASNVDYFTSEMSTVESQPLTHVDYGKNKKHASSLTRPAWERNSKVVFLMTNIGWGSIEDAESWAASPDGRVWFEGYVSRTVIALDA
jgi:hypothetical protein